ncbi:imidazole glycerol phosphate synthase subunit hisH [Raineyella antarctica]|uniref:Imidazole glycerol phosphate synthase subunit HisH n=1 Tax=Raineyella antarctica TaxID=1577474 RepID=A0A1G6GTC3_9ACTN|nr:imidazole glycerol phosphate synthase subunit HisH [Raineyella antarctica]SDB85171.1 imidazole glycerol phosphate synthase subunit hisH [Raineyella antarctica]
MAPGAQPVVALLDYGSGNLRSAFRALEAAGADVTLTSDPTLAHEADGLVVPGVGAFAACMDGLRSVGGDEVVRARVAEGRPVLGICVGHQILFGQGVEHGIEAVGVGVLPGVVERLAARRLPHMGWNTVSTPEEPGVFEGITDGWFYFVHSYGVHASPELLALPGVRVTYAEHGGDRFVAAVEYGAVTSTQFHPEKSGDAGAVVLRNWLGTLGA